MLEDESRRYRAGLTITFVGEPNPDDFIALIKGIETILDVQLISFLEVAEKRELPPYYVEPDELDGEIKALNLAPKSTLALRHAGRSNIRELHGMTDDELRNIKGIGPDRVQNIREQIEIFIDRVEDSEFPPQE